MKNFIILWLTLFASLPLITIQVNAKTFPDTVGTQYEQYINDLSNQGIVNGYTDGTFKPNEPVTRAEMAKFIFNGFNIKEDYGCEKFPDVEKNNQFNKYIHSIKCANIVSGYPDGGYKPNNEVKRGMVTKFIAEAMMNQEMYLSPYGPSPFEDVIYQYHRKGLSNEVTPGNKIFGKKIDTFEGSPFSDYIVALSHEEVGGTTIAYSSTGNFYPEYILTRGQMARFVSLGRQKLTESSINIGSTTGYKLVGFNKVGENYLVETKTFEFIQCSPDSYTYKGADCPNLYYISYLNSESFSFSLPGSMKIQPGLASDSPITVEKYFDTPSERNMNYDDWYWLTFDDNNLVKEIQLIFVP